MKARIAPPLHVAWEITRLCNAECQHCSSSSGPEFTACEPSLSKAREIIDQLAELGVRVLSFSGGEPLIREDLPDLIEYATAKGLSTHVCTNGSLVDEAMAIRLKEAGLHGITVSLDGARAETHDRLRRFTGLFDRAVAAIRTLVVQGHRVGISFTPTTANYHECAEAVHLAYSLGADSICLSQYVPTGRGTRDLMLSPAEFGDLAQDTIRLRQEYARRLRVYCHDCHLALELPEQERNGYKGCGAGVATAGIRADGSVTPCILMPAEAGNLNKNSFAQIWDQSLVLNELRDRELLQEGNCGSCKFKLVCGGCRAAAMAIHGSPLSGDPTCWLFPEEGVRP